MIIIPYDSHRNASSVNKMQTNQNNQLVRNVIIDEVWLKKKNRTGKYCYKSHVDTLIETPNDAHISYILIHWTLAHTFGTNWKYYINTT